MHSVRLNVVMVGFIFASVVLSGPDAMAQRQNQSKTQRSSSDSQSKVRASSWKARTNRNRGTEDSQELDAEQFMHSCYKLDAVLEPENAPLNFVTSRYQWDQPGGPGEPITVIYSYSNLLDGGIRGLTPNQLRQATEEALAIWATVAPLNFVEVEDAGPDPTAAESNYSASGTAQIRIGTHVMDGASGNELAHAYLPYSNSAGLAGDLHFDVDENWGADNGGFFLETMLHELGHCLGLDHEDDVDAIMNTIIMNRFSGLDAGFLLDDDVNGIESVYGAGSGTVTPQEGPTDDGPTDEGPTDEEPTDEEPTDEEPTDEEPTDEEPTDEEPTDEEPTDEEPTDEEPTDEGPTDEELVNDVVAEWDPETGSLTLKGDSSDNSMFIYSSRWFTLVMGYDETTINGNRGVIWWQSRDEVLDIVTSAGNDFVFVFGVRADTASVDLGAGDDGLVIIFSRLDTVEAEGGEGDDAMLNFFNRITSLLESGFESIW